MDNACFHCQQAIEKSLKAFLIYHGRDFEKTHNILFLISECTLINECFASIDTLNINAYAVQGRYPDSNIIPTKAEAMTYYLLAIEIKQMVSENMTLIFSAD